MEKSLMIYRIEQNRTEQNRTEQNRTEGNSAFFSSYSGWIYRTEYIRDG